MKRGECLALQLGSDFCGFPAKRPSLGRGYAPSWKLEGALALGSGRVGPGSGAANHGRPAGQFRCLHLRIIQPNLTACMSVCE